MLVYLLGASIIEFTRGTAHKGLAPIETQKSSCSFSAYMLLHKLLLCNLKNPQTFIFMIEMFVLLRK